MNSISLPLLRYAAAVAELGSFSAAARRCDVSQPTVSNAIAELEQLLGARLFERSTRKLSVTPAGAALMPSVLAVLDALTSLTRAAQALKTPPRKLLRVGFSQLLGAQRLALLFEPFAKLEGGVEFVYKECAQGDMEARLEAGSVDIVCGSGLRRAKNRGRQLLYREALRWVPPGWALPSERVGLREVARQRLLMTDGSCGLAPAVRELFTRARIPLDEYAGHALSYAALEEWAELGIGGAILPASHVRKAPSAALESAEQPVLLGYEAVWRKDLLVAEHARAFVRYLRTVLPRIARNMAPSAPRGSTP